MARPWLGAGSLVALLAGCAATPVGNGFEQRYAVARDALEDGRYDRAKRAYASLIAEAGPLAPRLRLEYAHAELRDENYAEAARIAGAIADQAQGTARAAALAVRGTALHELGLAALRDGDRDGAKARFTAARDALATVIEDHPDLDPLGGMADRHAAIRARLDRL